MTLRKRTLLLLVSACVALAGCSMFGGKKKELSEEEKKSRYNLSVMDEKLVPDPKFAETTVSLPAPVPAADWSQSGVTSAKLPGHVDAAPAFKVDWRADIGGGSTRVKRLVAAPVVKDKRIYVIDANQRVSALDADTGRKIWSEQLKAINKKDDYAVGGGLAVAGDKLIVPSGFGYVAALSLADGKEIWRRHTDSPMSGSPAILGDRGYVTSTNNEIYALDLNNGEVLWTDQAIAESARVLSSPSPAATNEILVAPYSSGELIAYLPANGRRLWQDTLTTIGRFTPLSAINDIAGRPSIQDGIVYAASYSGILTAIDTRSGTRLWNILFGSRQGPVIGGDYLFIVGTGGQVACLSKLDGAVVWVRNLPEFQKEKKKQKRIVWNGPVLASNRVIVTSSTGEVLALSAQTGETVSELKIGSPIYIEPIAADGRVFVLTDKGQLVAIR
jgi:outer membrane protein assembly factor BamB